MPELPDVEIFRRYFKKKALGQRIDRLSVPNPKVLQQTSPQALGRRLSGHRFKVGRRHGKYLFAQLERKNGCLVFHFGMTGFLKYHKREQNQPPHARLIIDFVNGHQLAYDCQRMFGKVDFADDMEAYVNERALGPDALKLKWKHFEEILGTKKGSVKSALMDQHSLAGIGNVYSDEILFHARVDPRAAVGKLDTKTLRRIFDSTKRVLKGAIKYRADPERMPSSWLVPHRGKRAECPRCGSKLKRVKIQQRSAYVCTTCQKR